MIKKFFIRKHWGYLVLPLMLLLVLPAHSQSAILECNQGTEMGIIRNYKNEVDITYNLYCDQLSFNYVDRNSMTIRSAPIPADLNVWDFVVYDGFVYFCGKKSRNYDRIAIFGYFNIQDVFFNNGLIAYYETDLDAIATLQKIDAKRTSSGDIHMVMIGTGYPSKSSPCSMIADAWLDISGNLTFKYTVESSETYQFDDVALTDSFAVVSAMGLTSAVSGSHNVLYYKEPVLSSNSYLDSWYLNQTPLWQADPGTLLSSQPIQITKMKRDGFATVCLSSFPGKIAVSIFSSPTAPPIKRFILPYDDYFQEIVYNPQKMTLFILEGWYGSLIYTKSPFVSTTKVTTNSGERWLSIDNTDADSFEIIFGYNYHMSNYWHFDDMNPDNCAEMEKDDNSDLVINEQSLILNQPPSYSMPDYYDYDPEIDMFELNISCP